MTVGRKPTVLAADTRMHVLKFFVLFFKQQWAQAAVFSNSLFALIFHLPSRYGSAYGFTSFVTTA